MAKEIFREHRREWVAVIIIAIACAFTPLLLGAIQSFFQGSPVDKSIIWEVVSRVIDFGTISLIVWFLIPTFKDLFSRSKRG